MKLPVDIADLIPRWAGRPEESDDVTVGILKLISMGK